MGGVGYRQGTGRVMFYDTKYDQIVQPEMEFTGRFSRTYEYLGYAMASCYDRRLAATFLFVGAPRSKNKGKVDYFRYSDTAAVSAQPLAKSVHFGSYFGSSVACGYTKLDTLQVH